MILIPYKNKGTEGNPLHLSFIPFLLLAFYFICFIFLCLPFINLQLFFTAFPLLFSFIFSCYVHLVLISLISHKICTVGLNCVVTYLAALHTKFSLVAWKIIAKEQIFLLSKVT